MFKLVSSLIFASLAAGVALASPLQDSPAANGLARRQSGQHHGSATFFFQGGAAGACGKVHKDTDHIVALQTTQYANGAHCGKTISITDPSTGKTATGVVADQCPGCGATDNIDLSEGLFKVFAPTSKGRINVVWKFV